GKALLDSARLDPRDAVAGLRRLLADPDAHIRINALRTLASFRDSTVSSAVVPLVADRDIGVAVQAETTLGVLRGAAALAALRPRARALLTHAVPAVRSVAADLLARHPNGDDVDLLVVAYTRAAGDPFNDARLSAVSALGAIAASSAAGRQRVAARFVSVTP